MFIPHSAFHIPQLMLAPALFIAASLLAGCGEQAPPAAGAMDCIRNMSQYSREGRVEDYLSCFDSTLRAKLEQARDEVKKGEFAEYLRRRAEPVRGFAMYDQLVLDENTVRIQVEWVFEDRNEVQTFGLKKVDGAWKIADMDEARYKKPPVPYGTKVFD